MIVAALGLEESCTIPVCINTFADNDIIPAYARNAAFVVSTLGLVGPDETGDLIRIPPYLWIYSKFVGPYIIHGDDLV